MVFMAAAFFPGGDDYATKELGQNIGTEYWDRGKKQGYLVAGFTTDDPVASDRL
jgi:hypothetical protein